jgi:hypothetical protein
MLLNIIRYTLSLMITLNGFAYSDTKQSHSKLFYPFVDAILDVPASSAASGDINGDGVDEIIVCSDVNLLIYKQNEFGKIPEYISSIPLPNLESKTYNHFIKLEDMNNDGLVDIILPSDNGITILFSQRNSFMPRRSIQINLKHLGHGYTYPDITIADLDNNGLKDIIGIENRGSYISVIPYFQKSLNNFEALNPYIVKMSGKNAQLSIADYNNDQLLDILVFSPFQENGTEIKDIFAFNNSEAERQISILIQNQRSRFNEAVYLQTGFLIDRGPEKLIAGDINNDGTTELITAHYTTSGKPVIAYWSIEKNRLKYLGELVAKGDIGSLSINDVNNDGRNDILMMHSKTGFIGVYLQDQFRTYENVQMYPIPKDLMYISDNLFINDLNDDGVKDLMMITSSSEMFILNGLGSEDLTPTLSSPVKPRKGNRKEKAKIEQKQRKSYTHQTNQRRNDNDKGNWQLEFEALEDQNYDVDIWQLEFEALEDQNYDEDLGFGDPLNQVIQGNFNEYHLNEKYSEGQKQQRNRFKAPRKK